MAIIFLENFSFFCPWCNLKFSTKDSAGVAQCPICGGKRSDGLNQLDERHFQCISCRCKFLNILMTQPVCPNACSLKVHEASRATVNAFRFNG